MTDIHWVAKRGSTFIADDVIAVTEDGVAPDLTGEAYTVTSHLRLHEGGEKLADVGLGDDLASGNIRPTLDPGDTADLPAPQVYVVDVKIVKADPDGYTRISPTYTIELLPEITQAES